MLRRGGGSVQRSRVCQASVQLWNILHIKDFKSLTDCYELKVLRVFDLFSNANGPLPFALCLSVGYIAMRSHTQSAK